MKIAILSCFHPYRGGIAQFNTSIFKELSKEHEVRAFNFSRQYPSVLFPGKTQFVTEGGESTSLVPSVAVLDSINPLSWRRCARMIADWKPDVLILRYWMSFFAPSLGYVARRLKKQCKVVAIMDNVVPHEKHFFDTPLTRYFLSGTDACVTLCKEVSDDLLRVKKDARFAVIPHPVYDNFGERLPKEEAEKKLGIRHGGRNILFFGLIRRYKGLDILIRAFNTLSCECQLIIAGEPYEPFDEYKALIGEGPRPNDVYVFPSYIPDSEVKNFFSAADVVVLPYRSATQSGINSIANHFGIPMIVTSVGGLKETIGEEGTGLLCEQATPECVAAAVEEYFSQPELREKFERNILKLREEMSWNGFCKKLTDFIEGIQK